MKHHAAVLKGIYTAILLTAFPVYAQSTSPILEKIEWCNIWVTNANQNDLPRVLFIGDSITQGYFDATEKLIGDKANCARITTSRSVCDPIFFDELSLILKQYQFSVIHFNNGLHGWGYTEDQYREGIAKFLDVLKKQAPQAKLVWGTSTPVLQNSGMSANSQRIIRRNEIAVALVKAAGIPVDDLYALASGHDEYYSKDDTHFNDDGKNIQAKQVAGIVVSLLDK